MLTQDLANVVRGLNGYLTHVAHISSSITTHFRLTTINSPPAQEIKDQIAPYP